MTGIEIVACVVMWLYVLTFLALTASVSRASGTSVWLFSVGRERQTLPAMLFRLAFALGLVLPPISKSVAAAGYGIAAELELGPLADAAGLFLMLSGAAAALYSQHYMGKSWRIGAAEGRLGAIVDTGPFRISRNPVFVGQACLFVGSLLVFPNLLQAGIVAGLLIAIVLQVRIEERVLSGELGKPYSEYRTRVRRWL